MTALANACRTINNAVRAKKRQVFIKHTSDELKKFLVEMHKHGYIHSLEFIQSVNKEKAVLSLTGRLNKCGAICPHFRHKCDEIPKVAASLKPARQFGHVMFLTSKGVCDQNEANDFRVGGKILGFFY